MVLNVREITPNSDITDVGIERKANLYLVANKYLKDKD